MLSIIEGWTAATAMHEIENPPDYQRHNCMKEHGTPMNHIVQAGYQEDFATFDYTLRVDESNMRDLNRKRKQVKNGKAKIEPLGSYYPRKRHITEDPYYGRLQLKTIYQQCERCCRVFLEKLC